ncbi:MAG: M3 family metallopeptidase [Deltaproteobacteria bacterium]|nr:M3 family metallopeptidase [Deltaproteobacteria bacterium]
MPRTLALLSLLLPLAAGAAADPNPLLAPWDGPFGIPPFARIRDEHFGPALRQAMAAVRSEVERIAAQPAAATFENTLEPLDAAGEPLERVQSVFQNRAGSDTTPAIQAVNREVAPLLAAHRDAIDMDPRLFARVRAVREAAAGLGPEQRMLVERTWKRMVRAGAGLEPAAQARLRAVNGELATLGVRFADNVLAETNAYRLVLDRPGQLDGLPPWLRAAAAEEAARAGLPGKWLFTLKAPSLWPFLQHARDRELRRQMFQAYTGRCDRGGPTDNKAVASRMAALRAEKARLLGFATWADYVLDDQMAGSPGQAYALLDRLWAPAKAAAAREAEELTRALQADGQALPLAPHDWFHYAERVRKERHDLDEDELRPYFALPRVRDGAFEVARRLYGITFTARPDLPVPGAEAQAWEVKEADGSHLAIFFTDYHPRPGKRSGAWASGFRGQWSRGGREVRPLVMNTCNFTRPVGGAPALLSLEEVHTLFHEFGHGLHAMLARKRFAALSRTPRDFVELPSQVMENWALEPAVLRGYARHWKTGEPIPERLVERIRAAERWNGGFRSVEYLAASLLDLDWHTLAAPAEQDAATLERISLARMGMPEAIVPRYRSTYFQHVFGPGDGYSAGYYSYRWAEVLDADAFALFQEKGLFDPATAGAFRALLARGGSVDPMELFVAFRGRKPSVEPLLRRLGFEAAH